MTIRILVADHHTVFRYYLTRYLDFLDRDYAVVGEAESAAGALVLVAARAPDLVLADLDLPDANGLHLARELHRLLPGVAVIVLGNEPAADYRPAALAAGARAYVDKLDVVRGLPPALLAAGSPR
ncbi:MAG TPA: response regulator [Thermomicrobiales bacterium]|nr:response regulator [Thermomicrobiales bacterium]